MNTFQAGFFGGELLTSYMVAKKFAYCQRDNGLILQKGEVVVNHYLFPVSVALSTAYLEEFSCQ